MIQDIYPHQFDNLFIEDTAIQDDDYVFYFEGSALLLKKVEDEFGIPRKNEFVNCQAHGRYLFRLDHSRCFLIWDEPDYYHGQLVFHEITSYLSITKKEMDWATMVAFQIKNWYAKNKFCGRCGAHTRHKKEERALVCPSCENVIYPHISPAIIVAVFNNGRILLARNVNFRNKFFSLVAGYVDVGESIEEAVRREVREEVGLDIDNIRYYKSQPWPYSGSMMIGFTADAIDGQEIRVDNKEIVEAGWYSRDNLPNHPPTRSIAGEIIEKYINQTLF